MSDDRSEPFVSRAMAEALATGRHPTVTSKRIAMWGNVFIRMWAARIDLDDKSNDIRIAIVRALAIAMGKPLGQRGLRDLSNLGWSKLQRHLADLVAERIVVVVPGPRRRGVRVPQWKLASAGR